MDGLPGAGGPHIEPAGVPFEGVIRGCFLFTGERLIPRGGVQIRAGRVAAILGSGEADPAGGEILDLPRALVHPGLLNAHAHLDLSGLEGRIPPGLPFPDWLSRVRCLRAEAGEAGLTDRARAGIRELVASGSTAVVDWSYGGHSEAPLRESGLRSVILWEVIGPWPQRASAAAAAARDWLAARTPGAGIVHGLAPHSPYLATGDLIRECKRLVGMGPFSIHAAELIAEEEFLRHGTGPLRGFLLGVGVPPEAIGPVMMGPVGLLDRLGVLYGALVIHGNFLGAEDIEILRRRRAAVVFCPRSHTYFGRPPHPLPDLLAAGVPVALGTDSSASNCGLSMAEEMREVRRQLPALGAREIFDLGTGVLAARHLPWIPGPGLEPGVRADLAAADVDGGQGDPLEAFLRPGSRAVLTMADGRKLFSVD